MLAAVTRVGALEYVVGTMSGHLEKVQLDIASNGSLQIRSEMVKPPNGHSKYSVQGLAASRNSGFLLIAYYAKRVSLTYKIVNPIGHSSNKNILISTEL